MNSILRIIAAFSFSLCVLSCSLIGTGKKTDEVPRVTREEVLSAVKPNALAAAQSYRVGDREEARSELQWILGEMQLADFHSLNEMVAYLDARISLKDGLTFKQMADELLTGSDVAEVNGEGTAGDDGETMLEEEAAPDLTERLPPPPDNEPLDRDYFSSDLHGFIRGEIKKVAVDMGEPDDFELPDDFVKEIEFYIRRFQRESYYHKFFNQALRRSRKYIPALKSIFAEKGFPEEILFLAFIESGFNPVARSRSNAVGMFQFIKSTGRQYGLKVTRYQDERNSPLKAAVACREYLHDLLLELGSFTLALSSYNSGAGKTRQALRQLDDFRDRSFWALREKTEVLRRETRQYVPQIFAAIVAGKPGNAGRFGFEDLPYPDESDYEMVIVPRPMSLQTLAEGAGLTVAQLRALNPDLEPAATRTPPRVIDYPLFVPRGKEKAVRKVVEKYTERHKEIAAKTPAASSSRRGGSSKGASAGGTLQYQVQRGNSLSQIAGWFGKSVADLRRWNPYLDRDVLRAGDVIEIRELNYNWSRSVHRVRRGETLSSIAARYGVRLEQLRGWNGLQDDRIVAGRKLNIYQREDKAVSLSSAARLPSPSSAQAAVMERQTIEPGEAFTYIVQSGNSLSHVSDLFGVKIADLQRWNNLRSHQIRVGQRLKVVAKRRIRFFKYRVQSGDTLESLAVRFDTQIAALRTANGISGSFLRAGKVIKIFSM